MSANLRMLYDAARHAELDSVQGRTFEEWEARVSDYGLDDARQSLEIWKHELEHSLATTFITLQREKNPAERTRLWGECLRVAKELEELTNE